MNNLTMKDLADKHTRHKYEHQPKAKCVAEAKSLTMKQKMAKRRQIEKIEEDKQVAREYDDMHYFEKMLRESAQ